MQRKHTLAIALGFLAVLGTVEMAEARMKFFPGTRSQVKAACVGAGREYHEGTGLLGAPYSMCIDSNTNIGVSCDSGGTCIASGEALRGAGVKPKPGRPRTNYEPPESLSESSDGGGEVPYDAPAPEPEIVIIH